MKLIDHLDKNTQEKLKKIRISKQRKNKPVNNDPLRSNEKFSEREIKSLMGMDRDRYERRGGAVRRR
ncbi:hypothetical protein RJD24_18670 [Bacillaceae bacterium IKA-2]|nr:hypothetical protein RJD24_18670 [Bacillaceae bacterium IKA-2]